MVVLFLIQVVPDTLYTFFEWWSTCGDKVYGKLFSSAMK